jgi:four helix bundle protein
MKENVVKSKSFAFAVRIVRLYQFLVEKEKEFVMSKQLLRSGTSVGAMVREGLNTPKQSRILHIRWLLHRKKSTKHFTGWNCCQKQIT